MMDAGERVTGERVRYPFGADDANGHALSIPEGDGDWHACPQFFRDCESRELGEKLWTCVSPSSDTVYPSLSCEGIQVSFS